MTDRLQPGDLQVAELCDRCGQPIQVQAAPWGQPVIFVKVGFCYHCQASYLGVQAPPGVDATPAVLDLVGRLLSPFR